MPRYKCTVKEMIHEERTVEIKVRKGTSLARVAELAEQAAIEQDCKAAFIGVTDRDVTDIKEMK